jgi:predicted ATP-binding protein involved in virulence
MLHGFADLHVQREPLHMVVSKNDQQLYVDQLSDGEKSILVMSADIARRLSIAHAKLSEPLSGEAVVAIDEIDLHLHPAWQRAVVGRLRSTFPNCQFIVTTHSPQVLSEVPTDSVVMLREFKVQQLSAPVSGRDTNSILTEVLGVSERPETESEELRQISRLIDQEKYADAQQHLELLAKKLTENDGEIVRLRTMLHFLESDREIYQEGA